MPYSLGNLARRRALAAFLLSAVLLAAVSPLPARAGVAIAMSGTFAGKVFAVGQGATESLAGVNVVVFNQGDTPIQARLVVDSPPEVQLSLGQTIFSLQAREHRTVEVTTITVGRYALTGDHPLTVRAELTPGSAGNLAVNAAVAQSATLRVSYTQGQPADFTDTWGHWGQQDIALMAQMGIARGVTEGQFAPDLPVTRAQFATFLRRALALRDLGPQRGHFRDVPASAWHYGAVEAVYAAGLVLGYEDGTFRPDARITREEVAAMVTRAIASRGRAIAVGNVELIMARFSDQAAVSTWAREVAAKAVQAGIITGRADGLFAPRETATRAEAVVMIKRMLSFLGLLVA